MTAKTPEVDERLLQLTRLYHLRDVVFPLARKMDEVGRLDMSIFAAPNATEHKCGTYGCLLGWAISTKELQRDGWRFDAGAPVRVVNGAIRYGPIEANFYWGDGAYGAFFGGNSYSGSLDQRAARLERWIEVREAELGRGGAHLRR